MAKLSITKQALAEAAAQKQTAIALSLNTTGLSYREQADMLLHLAQTIEALAHQEDEAAKLREKIAAKDPKLTTTTRIKPQAPEAVVLRGPKGEERGVAKLIEVAPKPKRKGPTRKRNLRDRSSSSLFPEPRGWGGDEGDEDEVILYSEDDDVEFQIAGRGEWQPGIVHDGGMGYYVIEDKHGRKHRVSERHIRKPLEW